MPFKDKDAALDAKRRSYRKRMEDPEFREKRRQRAREYMRAYYRDNPQHRAKHRKRSKKWVGENREFTNFQNSLRRYDITLDQYHAMFERQNEQCAICGAEDCALVIDHCHRTGRVRGLLCHSCNTGIGALRESPDLFARATRYVSHTSER